MHVQDRPVSTGQLWDCVFCLACACARMWRSEDQVLELLLSLHLVGPQDQTQVVSLRDRPLCLLSHSPAQECTRSVTSVCPNRRDQSHGHFMGSHRPLLGSLTRGHHLGPLPDNYLI